MRIVIFLAFSLGLCSCSKDQDVFCDLLTQRNLAAEAPLMLRAIDLMLVDMPPNPSESDRCHEANLIRFVDQIDDSCEGIGAELHCYGCIYTDPPISEITLTFADGNRWVLDIVTPMDGTMYHGGIHRSY